MRPFLLLAPAALLAACAAPYSGPTEEELARAVIEAERRDAMLAGAAPLQPGQTEAERIAAEARAALDRTGGAAPFDPVAAPGPVRPVEIATLDLDRDNPTISQEQDFDAVSAERGIEADAERIRAAREQRVEIAPQPLQRPDDLGPNVFDYAVNEARPVGSTGAYGRGLRASAERAANQCAGYASSELAQTAFLEAGGPERDRLGLDPDGDGNACGWDPAVVRNALGR